MLRRLQPHLRGADVYAELTYRAMPGRQEYLFADAHWMVRRIKSSIAKGDKDGKHDINARAAAAAVGAHRLHRFHSGGRRLAGNPGGGGGAFWPRSGQRRG